MMANLWEKSQMKKKKETILDQGSANVYTHLIAKT